MKPTDSVGSSPAAAETVIRASEAAWKLVPKPIVAHSFRPARLPVVATGGADTAGYLSLLGSPWSHATVASRPGMLTAGSPVSMLLLAVLCDIHGYPDETKK